MCGIVGYVGNEYAVPIVLEGIEKQEYRGYDSWGIGANADGEIIIVKLKKPDDKEFDWFVEQVMRVDFCSSRNAIGHNRWATNGEPSDINAHPQTDCTRKIALVHNGTIENYRELKDFLLALGHIIKSETDSELIAHLIEEMQKQNGSDFRTAVIKAANQLQGAFALLIMHADHPTLQVAVKKGSPLVYAEVKPGCFMVASSPLPIIKYTRNGKDIEDGQIVFIENGKAEEFSFADEKIVINPIIFEGTEEELKHEGFPHFMLKEIHEQPDKLSETIAGRVFVHEPFVRLGGVEPVLDRLLACDQFFFIGSGTSYRAAMIGAWMFKNNLNVRAQAVQASEVGSHAILAGCRPDKTVAFAISQSGETRDLQLAIEEIQAKGVMCLGIVNVVGSKIARMTKAGIYLRVGPEIGVASTKAFTAMVLCEAMLTLLLGRHKSMTRDECVTFAGQILAVPGSLGLIFQQVDKIQALAKSMVGQPALMLLGRGYHYATILEGALKMTEVAYIAAVPELAGEMKHGPIALIRPNFPVIVVAVKDGLRDAVIQNIMEIQARGAFVIGICTKGDDEMLKLVNESFVIPDLPSHLATIPAAVIFQLLAYYLGIERGYNVDKPRNLAKAVTVV